MSGAKIGKIRDFDVKTGNWTLYVERLEMYFKVNKVEKDMWLAILITGVGDETYELLSTLCSPSKPAEVTYERAVTILKNHLQPKPAVMAERYRFRQRRQKDDESITPYLTEIKKLSKTCEFGGNLEENLRDQLVCGLKSDVIRQRLFAEDNLTYSGAVKLACGLEAAERDAAVVDQKASAEVPATVHALSTKRGRDQRRSYECGAPDADKGAGANCTACGWRGHTSDQCRYRNFVCSKCKQAGHLRRVCSRSGASTGRGKMRGVNHVKAASSQQPGEMGEDSSADELGEELHQLCLNGYTPVSLSLLVDDTYINMEIDTGSAVSCISKKTYNRYFSNRLIEPFNLVLKFYDGSNIKPVGVIRPKVQYKNKMKHLELFVIDGGTTSLLGRQWLSELEIKIPQFQQAIINYGDRVNIKSDTANFLLNRYKELFGSGLGRYTGGKATLQLREGATPVFCRARPLPYALKGQVDAELDAMLRAGVIEPVECSDWATPLVPVRKADGGLRICADYKVTLNPVLLVNRYPLPKIDDLLVSLNGATLFSKIDLSQAYNQVELDDSKDLTVINTHRGLFKYNRLVFGLSSSPGIFQRIMSNLLSDIPGVEIFLDDVIIGTSGTWHKHLETLERVFQRLQSHGMRLKKSKCLFMVEEVKYLGYVISKDGIKVDKEKVNAIVKIPRPENVTELRAFLGLVNFYAKFVKNLSSILSPLYELLKKGVSWNWSVQCEKAMSNVKKILTGAEVLAHYDPDKSLVLTCDASARGIGGVLTQPGADGRDRPVVYVSRSLNNAEKHYSQIDREALAIIFCLKKLHQYVYGRRFTLRTDHKPLVSIFGPKHGVPAMAASRLQRWAIILSAYTYDIEYVNTKQNGADGLSRLPVIGSSDESLHILPEQTYLHFAQNALLLDHNIIKQQTMRDPMLSRVISHIRDMWPTDNEIRELQPYYNRRRELYEELGCVMWGHRVVIPGSCRARVLRELHEPHMGIVKTKASARSYVWWPGIDEAIEATCRECEVCAGEADAPQRHTVTPWPWPSRPWARIHLDFLGPIFGKIYLVMVDARTKWLEIFPVPSTAASFTIEKLRETFSRWGLPKQIVSDNGPPFSSREMSDFLTNNGVEHIFSAPYHPASNGAAENAVRTVKRVIKKAVKQKENINEFLSTFLLHYRNTEHCSTGDSPANLMLGRNLRTKLDALRPNREDKVKKAQERQQKVGTERSLQLGEDIWMRQYRGNEKWLPGQIVKRMGTTDYRVVDGSGNETHRHIDQLRQRSRSSLIYPTSTTERSSLDAERSKVPEVAPVPVGVEVPNSETRIPQSVRELSPDRTAIVDVLPSTSESSSIPHSNVSNPNPNKNVPISHDSLPEGSRTRPIRECRLKRPPNYCNR